MRLHVSVPSTVLVAALLAGVAAAEASQQISVTPAAVTSPVTQDTPLTLCVSGFAPGNFVSIQVPMAGTPEVHSNIGYSFTIDASGGLCFTTPPVWTDLNLVPGSYAIPTYWNRDGSGLLRDGPAATLTVTGYAEPPDEWPPRTPSRGRRPRR